MPAELSSDSMAKTLDEILELLSDYHNAPSDPASAPEPLPSLLKQCEAALAAVEGSQPLRCIHHFACTGGTLISKAIFGLPNTVILSELDPLSEMILWRLDKGGHHLFAPTDLIFSLRQSIRAVEDETLVAVFVAGLEAAKRYMEAQGQHLVLRDHPHAHFCRHAVDYDERPTVREMLSRNFTLLSLVTMRHPLDSFLSLKKNGWVNFSPSTLENYACRYLAFLDRHKGLPVILYEDFVTAPEAELKRICALLDLPFSPLALDLLPIARLSGDSGRNEGPISPRSRRPVPNEVEVQRFESSNYQILCARFGYEP